MFAGLQIGGRLYWEPDQRLFMLQYVTVYLDLLRVPRLYEKPGLKMMD